MEKVYQRWETKAPQYPTEYRPLVEKLARIADIARSTGTEEEQFERGKKYGTVYELYMDAVIQGLKADNPLPFDRGKEGTKFLEIGNWKQHKEITRYIFMCLLAKANWLFEELENLTDEQANEKANELLHLMEAYGKGGLEIINQKDNR